MSQSKRPELQTYSIPVLCRSSRAQALLEHVRLQLGVSNRGWHGNWVRQLVPQEIAQDGPAIRVRILAAGDRDEVRPCATVWTNAVTFSQSQLNGILAHRRTQEHHCRLTRHLLPWRIGGTQHTLQALIGKMPTSARANPARLPRDRSCRCQLGPPHR